MERITERILSFNKEYPAERALFKLGTMAKNSFRFFRATNHIFYEDVAQRNGLPASPPAWISGDLHLENFGTYKSDNRLVYFDLNDFDEAVLAPAALELVRMVTSILVAFDAIRIEDRKVQRMAELFVDNYIATLLKGKPDYIEPQTAGGILHEFMKAAQTRKHKRLLAKKTVEEKGRRQLSLDYTSHKKLDPQLRARIIEHVTSWLQQDDHSPYNYKAVDAVFRLAGAGSVGVNRYVILLESMNNKGEKHLLVDMKEARQSALLPYLTTPQPDWQHHAQRVVTIQQRMQNRPPALLSTTEFNNASYVMEEMQSAEDKIHFKLLKHDYRGMHQVISVMGSLAASAQWRSSGRDGSATADELMSFAAASADWKNGILQQAIIHAQLMNVYYLQFLKDKAASLFKKQWNALNKPALILQ